VLLKLFAEIFEALDLLENHVPASAIPDEQATLADRGRARAIRADYLQALDVRPGNEVRPCLMSRTNPESGMCGLDWAKALPIRADPEHANAGKDREDS
jgi:hypothetical protein